MTTTIADITKQVFDGVAGGLSGVIKDLTLSHEEQGAYDPAAGTYALTTTAITGRVVVAAATPASDVFPDYVIGPADMLVMAEGLASAPKEGDTATFDSKDHAVRRVLDIAGGGGAYYMVVR